MRYVTLGRMGATSEQLAGYERIKAAGLTPVPPEDQPYGGEWHTADGIFVKQMAIPKKGTIVPQHVHTWDHTSMLASGSVLVWKNGKIDRQYTAPACIFIKAGIRHRFLSLEDNTVVLCIHNEDRIPEIRALMESE